MSIYQSAEFCCDCCGTLYTLDEKDPIMELPPGWLYIQISMANDEGFVPEFGGDIFLHFCSAECLVEHINGDTLAEQLIAPADLGSEASVEEGDEEDEEEQGDHGEQSYGSDEQ